MDQTLIERYKELGLNVTLYRRKCGLTQEQLAERVKVERNHISNIELANVAASLDVVFRLADALDVPVSKLFEAK